MSTHDKTVFCETCRKLSAIRRRWLKGPCRDCPGWSKSFYHFLIVHALAGHEDDRLTIEHVNSRVNSLLRWVIEDLQPGLDDSKLEISPETFIKVLTLAHL